MRSLILALLFSAAASQAGAQSTIFGTARATDGDGLSISGIVVRLHGIDAPELAQTCNRRGEVWACGEEAKRQLQAIVEGQTVSCRQVDADDNGRAVSVCTAGRTDVGRAMVSSGWATAFRKYSDAYIGEELAAKTAGIGIWGSEFEVPADYRHRRQNAASVAARSNPRVARRDPPTGAYGCTIKGNVSRKGDLIYHLPGMPYYAETRAEQMFCSEADAQAAGYRRSRAHW